MSRVQRSIQGCLRVAYESPPMLESPLSWILTASRNVKVSFLQGFFESAAKVDEEKRRVAVNISPFNAPIVMRLLLEVGAYPIASSVEPAQFAVSVEDAARIPLFSPATSRKLDRVVSLARPQRVRLSSSDPCDS